MNRGMLWLVCLTTLASAPGCAYLRGPAGAGPPAETFRWKRPPAPETAATERPDSSATVLPQPVRRPPARPPETEPVTAETPPATTPEPPEVDLSVELPPAERAKLAEDARAQIAEAQHVVSTTRESSLTEIGRETLATIRELILAANDALKAGDVRAAESLARKAQLLAIELRAP